MKSIALDTEATGISRTSRPFMVSLCDDEGEQNVFTWDVDPFTRKPKVPREDKQQIRELVRDKHIVFHNRSFDIRMMASIGVNLRWRNGKSSDTVYLSHIFDSDVHAFNQGKLKRLALHYLDYAEDDEKELRKAVSDAKKIARKLGWNVIPQDDHGDHIAQDYWVPRAVAKHENYDPDHPWWTVTETYANGDTERTELLYLLFQQLMSKWDDDDPRKRLIEREDRIGQVLYDMQNEGMHVHTKRINKELKTRKPLIDEAEKEIRRVTLSPEFNIRSPKQVSAFVIDTLQLPVLKTTATGNPSMDKEAMAEYSENPQMGTRNKSLIRKRERFFNAWNKYANNNFFVQSLESYERLRIGSRLYPNLLQCGTGTTRMASKDPNGQNVKKSDPDAGVEGLRIVFGPDDDAIWVCIDYSQLQLRIFANVAQEDSMIEAFEQGFDFHAFVASKIFGKHPDEINKIERRIGKNVNFGFIFGASPKKIEMTAGIDGLWDTVCTLFPSAHSFMEITKRQVRRKGFVSTPHGYRLTCNQPHKGVNYIVQGCEGDVVKLGMIEAENYLSDRQAEGYKGAMIFQVHDELIFRLPKNDKRNKKVVSRLKKAMEKPGQEIGMYLPVDVEYTTTHWDEAKEMTL